MHASVLAAGGRPRLQRAAAEQRSSAPRLQRAAAEQRSSAPRPRPHRRCVRAAAAAATGSASELLQLELDGFDAARAAAAYPPLADVPAARAADGLAMLRRLLPERILGKLLTAHPALVDVDLQVWLDFLTSFGMTDEQLQELLRACPEALTRCSVFQAGQLLLFLRADMGLDQSELLRHFKWAACLGPDTTQASMAEVTSMLCQHAGVPPEPAQRLALLAAFPEVLGWRAERDLAPKLAFFEGLGLEGRALLADTCWDEDTRSWIPGLRSWHYSVQPKLALLQQLLGSEQAAMQLAGRCPAILKMAVETKLKPVLEALGALGLDGEQLAQLIQQCPKLLAQKKDALLSRANFLLDVIGGSAEELMAWPAYLLTSLEDVIGPRYFFLARSRWVDAFSDAASGQLDLRRVMEPPLEAFLDDVASQVTGQSKQKLARSYELRAAEFEVLIGWAAEKAFANLEQAQSEGLYREQLNLFYLLVQ